MKVNYKKVFPMNKEENIHDQKKFNVYCLPSAGSSASMYSIWKDYATEWLNIYPVEYPGHGTRIKETLVSDPNQITQEITDAILNKNNKQFILFGHSIGTAFVCRIIKELQHRKQEHRIKLIAISGRRETATLRNEPKNRHLLPKDQFIKAISKYAGIPRELLDQDDILDFFLPILRNDFHLNDFLIDDESIFTDCPLIAIGGDQDLDLISSTMMEKWSANTKVWLGYHPLPGGHFYLNNEDNARKIIELISSNLSK